jgi:hypothetical protein
MPERAWWVFNRLGVRRSPVDLFVRLVDAGSDVLVVVGGEAAARIQRGATRSIRKLARSERFEYDVIDNLDHAMLGADDVRRVSDIVYRHVCDRFAPLATVDEKVDAISPGIGGGDEATPS